MADGSRSFNSPTPQKSALVKAVDFLLREGGSLMDAIAQAKHTARLLISEARVRRVGNGHGVWCFFNTAQSARLRAAALPRPPRSTLPIQPELFE